MPTVSRIARFAAMLVAFAIVLSVSGCGREVNVQEGIEGERVSLDGIDYQVQLSRILNPADNEDRSYTRKQPPAPAGENYFGVFIRVEGRDDYKGTRTPVDIEAMKLVDTTGKEFHPIDVSQTAPDFAYIPRPLGQYDLIPERDSASGNGPIRGSLVLFRFPDTAQENRPMEFEIEGRDGKTGHIELDL